jgi:group I intron endonuclease
LLQYFNSEYLLKHESFVICRALLKQGYSNFNLEILEYCDPKDLIKREQYYIDLLNPEYNILKKAGSPLGFKHREETITKMSISKTGEKNPMFGKTGVQHPMFGKTGEKKSYVRKTKT